MDEMSGLEAPITAVTVFSDGARVTRSGRAEIEPGLAEIVVKSLPDSADPASVRVAVLGSGVALLEVQVHRGFGADPLRDEVVRLRTEAERCRDAVQALDDEDAAEQAHLTFTAHLSHAAAEAMARAVGFGRAGQDDLARMSDQLSASTGSALERRREIAARKRSAQRELDAAEQRLADAERRAGPPEYVEVAATLEAAERTTADVELSYHVSGASWRPLYDLGLTGELLTVGYLAEVTQRTGEDWPAVELTLSTSRPGQHRTLPELRPWYVGRVRPAPPPPMPQRAPMAAAAMQPGRFEITAEKAPGLRAAEVLAGPLTAEPGETAAGLTYRVPRPLAVPADGDPHKTAIARLDLDAVLDHLAVPVLAAEAYLRATVTNTSPLLLLPGPARIFHDGQFAGETTLDTIASGEEFELQLGVDDQIRVERKLHRRSTSKAVIGGTRTIDIAYETTVENHRKAAARIGVRDHIPVSTDGDIKVRLREASPDPAEQTDLGELRWNLSLDPGQSATIRYRFTIEHPPGLTVTGL